MRLPGKLEINAMGTEWDLMLTKPYKNGGKAINGWNINGLRKAIHLELQMVYFEKNNKFAVNLEELRASDIGLDKVKFEVSASRFELSAPSIKNGDWWHITEDSRIWKGKIPAN